MPQTFKERMLEEEQKQRQTLGTLVDDAFEAYINAGNSPDEYAKTQWFQSVLFKAINDTPEATYQRQGALLVAIRFMQRLIRFYGDQHLDPERQAPTGKRQ